MASVRWSLNARQNLQDIILSRESHPGASSLAESIRLAAARLEDYPRIGRMVPEFEDPSIRELIVGPYRIFYVVDGDDVILLAIVHGRRNVMRRRGR